MDELTKEQRRLLAPLAKGIEDTFLNYRNQMADYGNFPDDWQSDSARIINEHGFATSEYQDVSHDQEHAMDALKEIIEGFFDEAEEKAFQLLNELVNLKHSCLPYLVVSTDVDTEIDGGFIHKYYISKCSKCGKEFTCHAQIEAEEILEEKEDI